MYKWLKTKWMFWRVAIFHNKKEIATIAGILALVLTILTTDIASNPYDSTDDKENGIRSGMMLKTDYGTGCQYLVTVLGGITPRYKSDGKTVYCKASGERKDVR